ncbi:hypothetical protein EV361DRAFT_962692 [Lentinula raphanica]|nr:hypothetical protein EV361DRAFT_962692 [Lentinula raphanica]
MTPMLLVLFLGFLILGTSAVDVKGQISWNDICRGYSQLGHAKVVLDNMRYSGGILRDGFFIIPNVPSGTYLLSVISHDHQFDQMRVDIKDDSVEVHPYIPGTPMNPPSTILLPYPITLSARQRFNYFAPRESFNIMGMLKSPMILMMIFGGGLVLGMPYLMKNMDPEALEDFKREQAKMSNAQAALQSGDLKSGFSALMAAASGQEQTNPQPTPQAPRGQAPNKSRGKGNKRR